MLQLLSSLDYLHEAGLLHLDLKPSNIMFVTNALDQIVLLDFGISKSFIQNHSTLLVGLTLYYSPPEMNV